MTNINSELWRCAAGRRCSPKVFVGLTVASPGPRCEDTADYELGLTLDKAFHRVARHLLINLVRESLASFSRRWLSSIADSPALIIAAAAFALLAFFFLGGGTVKMRQCGRPTGNPPSSRRPAPAPSSVASRRGSGNLNTQRKRQKVREARDCLL